jgi:predicted transcriptional regulator
MLTWEDDLEIDALHKRGWTISAIARHTGKNRRTIRNYLTGSSPPAYADRPHLICSTRSSTT